MVVQIYTCTEQQMSDQMQKSQVLSRMEFTVLCHDACARNAHMPTCAQTHANM